MYSRRAFRRSVVTNVVIGLVGLMWVHQAGQRAEACGGFFCSATPINQTAEQIIFHKDGNNVTAIVMIQYQGPAEDFSWVVPVPGIPDLALSSSLLFSSFEPATRPQFNLDVERIGCPIPPIFFDAGGVPLSPAADGGSAGGAPQEVQVLQQLTVGPFDIQIVNSQNPDALAQWLVDNNYDLSDRGRDLIAPYVEMGMNFVALRLQKDSDVGDIQPLKMRYVTDRPMIPIKLTAVAAEPDMGIIVWLFGPARAVPLNFLHVEVNYARLNWFLGTFGGYSSYQQLVTEAMNEAGGQGFATDYAARDSSLREQLPDAATLREFLDERRAESDAARALVNLGRNLTFPQATMRSLFAAALPLPEGESLFAYGNANRLRALFSDAELEAARGSILDALKTSVLDPYEDSLTIFDGDPYITRMYTTLSPEEMTLDPVFSFNADLAGQQLARNAKLRINCLVEPPEWELELGEGTGRDGEIVLRGTGDQPFAVPEEVTRQSAVKATQWLRESGQPEAVTTNTFGTVVVGDPINILATLCGLFTLPFFAAPMFGIGWMRHRLRSKHQ